MIAHDSNLIAKIASCFIMIVYMYTFDDIYGDIVKYRAVTPDELGCRPSPELILNLLTVNRDRIKPIGI
jgi:hypothetical protein